MINQMNPVVFGTLLLAALLSVVPAYGQSTLGGPQGITLDLDGQPFSQAQLIVDLNENANRSAVSGADGASIVYNLKPWRYLSASKERFKSPSVTSAQLAARQSLRSDLNPVASVKSQGGFFRRLFRAYAKDWKGTAEDEPEPPRRGFPAPLSSPPFPFSDWPYGGSPDIGAPDTSVYPLMQAIYGGRHGEGWEASRVKIYGWINGGFNVSSSNNGKYANAPAAYYQLPNSFQLDQVTLYIQRLPDTVQKDLVPQIQQFMAHVDRSMVYVREGRAKYFWTDTDPDEREWGLVLSRTGSVLCPGVGDCQLRGERVLEEELPHDT